MGALDNFKLGNIKKGWESMQNDPYQAAKFEYRAFKYFAIGLIVIIAIMFLQLIIRMDGGSSWMTQLSRAFTVLVGVILLSQIWFKVVVPKKQILQQYEQNPVSLQGKSINVAAEVDQIFADFEKKGDRGDASKEV